MENSAFNLYSIKCEVDNGYYREQWETFVFANCPNSAKYEAAEYFEKQSMETVVRNMTCEKSDYTNLGIVCARRIK